MLLTELEPDSVTMTTFPLESVVVTTVPEPELEESATVATFPLESVLVTTAPLTLPDPDSVTVTTWPFESVVTTAVLPLAPSVPDPV